MSPLILGIVLIVAGLLMCHFRSSIGSALLAKIVHVAGILILVLGLLLLLYPVIVWLYAQLVAMFGLK